MIPISSPICLTCRHRYEKAPMYCYNRITIAGGPEQQCPGPVVQVFAEAPAPPTLAELEAEIA